MAANEPSRFPARQRTIEQYFKPKTQSGPPVHTSHELTLDEPREPRRSPITIVLGRKEGPGRHYIISRKSASLSQFLTDDLEHKAEHSSMRPNERHVVYLTGDRDSSVMKPLLQRYSMSEFWNNLNPHVLDAVIEYLKHYNGNAEHIVTPQAPLQSLSMSVTTTSYPKRPI